MDLRNVQDVNYLFGVYFIAEKSRYRFGKCSFEAIFGSLGIKLIIPHRGIYEECCSIIITLKIQK